KRANNCRTLLIEWRRGRRLSLHVKAKPWHNWYAHRKRSSRCRPLLNSAEDWVSSELPPYSYCVRNEMPNESAYIDTSVLGAYYCPELLSAAAEDALRRIEAPVISTLSEVEFCSLISKKRRLKEFNPRQAKEILD